MKVFVIIVSYNGAKWLNSCLGSLRSSSIPVSPIIIDNNSSDNTIDLIKTSYPEVYIIENKENLGFGKANNVGIKYALQQGGDYFFLLNQDAWIQPDTIEKLIETNKMYPEYLILSPLHLDGTGKKLDYNFSLWISPNECPNLISDLILKEVPQNGVYQTKFVNAALWLLSRKCILTIGGFDPIFSHYGEDNDYTFRVNYHGYKIGIYPTATGIHDRYQEPVNLDKLPRNKKFNRKLNANLEILKDINKPFTFCIIKSAGYILTALIKDIIKFDYKNYIVDMKVAVFVFVNLYNVYRHRRLSKKKGCIFLNYS
jgi:GT2 family glycosyltransferase